MEVKIICMILLVHWNVFAKAESDFRLENRTNKSIDDLEPENGESGIHKNHRRLVTIQRYDDEFPTPGTVQDARKIGDSNASQERARTPEEEKELKVLKFGERVLNSVNEHGLLENESDLLRSGNYRIDWWEKDRRLEKIRKRLHEELARRPELSALLNSLCYRNASRKISPKKKNPSDRTTRKKSALTSKNGRKNTLLRRMMMASQKLLGMDMTKFNEEASIQQPIVFVYVNILLPPPVEIDHNEDITTNEIPDAPVKFSLTTPERTGFGSIDDDATNVDNQTMPNYDDDVEATPNPLESPGPTTLNPTNVSTASNYPLQLIPLLVDELRNDRIDDDERLSLSWIYGRRIWHLLEREASKKLDETMDKDLATFLVKGELPERDRGMENRRKRRPTRSIIDELRNGRRISKKSIDEEDSMVEPDVDNDFKDFYREYDNGVKNYYANAEPRFDVAPRLEARRLEMKRKIREEENLELYRNDYDDYSYPDYPFER